MLNDRSNIRQWNLQSEGNFVERETTWAGFARFYSAHKFLTFTKLKYNDSHR